MTRQESFKRRVRARMEKTGERYGAARRVLLEQAGHRRRRQWVAEPEMSDEAVHEATGRGWDDWCDLIDAWPGHGDGHTAVAAFVRDQHGIPGWWAQTVTVGWERITGRRLPYQRPDGTFTAGKSRTVRVDAAELRAMLLDEADRDDLFPGQQTVLRSRATTKDVRIAIGPGTALFTLEAQPDRRTKVTVTHERLPEYDDVQEWKLYWDKWLEALSEG